MVWHNLILIFFYFRYNRNLIAQFIYTSLLVCFSYELIKTKNQDYRKTKKQILDLDASESEKYNLIKYEKLGDYFKLISKYWLLLNCLIQPTHNLIVLSLWSLKSYLVKTVLNDLSMNNLNLLAVNENQSYDLVSFRNYFYFYYIITQACYFTQGNSNSLNTIQVSSGLVGINQINEIVVAILLISATYSANIYWFFEGIQHLLAIKLRITIELIRKKGKVFIKEKLNEK